MSERIYNRIREILKATPGLTQKGLAARMGLDPAAVNRMLWGQRKIMVDELPLIEGYIGQRLALSAPAPHGDIEHRQGAALPPMAHAPDNIVPVYSCVAGAAPQHGFTLNDDDVVDWVARHPAQFGISHAFAIYVTSDAMAPRYFRGELVYIHPGRPPEAGRDCLIEMKNGEAYIKHFLHQGENKIHVAQFNPAQEKDFRRDDIKAIYAVVGRG